jgi:cell wall-associated NlpC family hydrolase
MRRRTVLAVMAATFALSAVFSQAVFAAKRIDPNWAQAQIEQVVAAGLMGPDVAEFRPDEPLTRGELHEAILALGKVHTAPVDPHRLVTMRELDAQLVGALGLISTSRTIRLGARDAGLEPTGMLGTETVARLLGLRLNHPQGSEQLERLPSVPAPRAEAAYSLAQILSLDPQRLADLTAVPATFAFPGYTKWQREVVERGLKLVGYPYVFAGSSEKRVQQLWSSTGLIDAPGGFDCSGFVWRVYKLQLFDGAPQLADVLRGRTSYAMSSEVTPSRRIGFQAIEPGDVLFFGSRGPKSKPAQVGHMGIAVGNGWFVHSSGNGVTLQPLTGWYATSFAWARRPLAEAGLA